jgi:hypothetical protein
MLRISLLAAALATLAASSSDSYQFQQRGTVPAPRAALHDGQPLTQPVRLEGHAGAIVSGREGAVSPGAGQGAAVAGKQAGGAMRVRVNHVVDLGVEVDTSWSPAATTRDGLPIDAPDDHVLDLALAFRTSSKLDERGDTRVGVVFNLGGHSVPVIRDDGFNDSAQRDTALLVRAAVVPSMRRGPVTFFGSLGLASETDVPGDVWVDDGGEDPGVVADSIGACVTLAAGATVDVGGGARVTARIGDAFTSEANEHYGPQVDLGLAFDLGGVR